MKEKLSKFLQYTRQLPIKKKLAIFGIPLILIILLILLLVFMGIKNKSGKTITQKASQNTILYSTLLFSPNSLPLKKGIQSSTIVLDMGANSAGKISFTVKFDPKSVTTLDLVQKLDATSPLSYSFTTEELFVAPEGGTARITLTLKEGAVEQIGRGEIAQLSFIANPTYQGTIGFTIEDISITSTKPKSSFVPQTNTLIIQSQ